MGEGGAVRGDAAAGGAAGWSIADSAAVSVMQSSVENQRSDAVSLCADKRVR